MFRSLQLDYSQVVLIDRINEYQRLHKRPLISTTGYCHGLAVVWLSKMVEQKVEWFYNMVKYLVHQRPEDYDEITFEKFLAQIEFGQNPLNSGLNITQRHLRIILEMTNIESTCFSGTFPNLQRKIRPKKYPAMYLITNANHAIAIFHRGDTYYVYDSNYTTGEAKMFGSQQAAANEVVARLLPEDKRTADEEFELNLNFIPLAGYLTHPTGEVIVDIPTDEQRFGVDEESADDLPSYRCVIL